MILALFVENIIAIEAVTAFLFPFFLILAIIFTGLYIGPSTPAKK